MTVVKYPASGPKFAFIVSSKSAPQAVSRNKIKRRARSIIEKVAMNLPKDRVYLFNFNKQAKDVSFQELERDILNALRSV